jgi:surface protein
MKSAITDYAIGGTNVPFRRDSTDPATAVTWNNIVTTLMTDMRNLFNMFITNAPFNQPIASWDTSAVTTMQSMFDSLSAITFNQPIGAWNTSSVTTMRFMFSNAQAFNQPIGAWNTSSVNNMQSMFNNAYAFNQNLTGWDVDQVTSYSGFRTGSGLTIENTPVLFR